MRFRNPGPSAARMAKMLNISKTDSVALKALMEAGYIKRTLKHADQLLDGSGVEYLVPTNDTSPIAYVNMGDAYAPTLMFDHDKNRFIVGTWGDVVERQPRRFAD